MGQCLRYQMQWEDLEEYQVGSQVTDSWDRTRSFPGQEGHRGELLPKVWSLPGWQ